MLKFILLPLDVMGHTVYNVPGVISIQVQQHKEFGPGIYCTFLIYIYIYIYIERERERETISECYFKLY